MQAHFRALPLGVQGPGMVNYCRLGIVASAASLRSQYAIGFLDAGQPYFQFRPLRTDLLG